MIKLSSLSYKRSASSQSLWIDSLAEILDNPAVMPSYAHRRGETQEFRRKFILFLLKCVIMVVVFSIFLFFLGFAAIVLLHFLFMSNTFHRRCFHRTDSPARSIVSPTANAFGSPHMQARLVSGVYSAADIQRTRDCAICLDSFQEGDNCSTLPVCNHLFHAKCVDRWIQKRPNCPICRTGIDLNSGLPGSSISGDDTWRRLWPIGFEEGNSHN